MRHEARPLVVLRAPTSARYPIGLCVASLTSGVDIESHYAFSVKVARGIIADLQAQILAKGSKRKAGRK